MTQQHYYLLRTRDSILIRVKNYLRQHIASLDLLNIKETLFLKIPFLSKEMTCLTNFLFSILRAAGHPAVDNHIDSTLAEYDEGGQQCSIQRFTHHSAAHVDSTHYLEL